MPAIFKVYIPNIKELYRPPFKGVLYVKNLMGDTTIL